MPNQAAMDRPDLSARVFTWNARNLRTIWQGSMFLVELLDTFTLMEFQKWGLPHLQALLIVVPEDSDDEGLVEMV
jgi:hypothetical protein